MMSSSRKALNNILLLSIICFSASCQSVKHENSEYEAFFIEHFNQVAKPNIEYVLKSADRKVTLVEDEAQALIDSLYTRNDREEVDLDSLYIDVLIYKPNTNQSIRIGNNISCRNLVIASDNTGVCDLDFTSKIWDVLEEY